MTIFRITPYVTAIVCFLLMGQASAASIDSSEFWKAEAEKYYRHATERDHQRVPSSILNMRCTTDRWTRPRGLNRWWNTKICCLDIGCCEKSDKENYPNIQAENCMREKIRAKIASAESESYSRSRYAEYGLEISDHDSTHWNDHRNNVNKDRWENDFHRDVVKRLFGQCHDPIGNDLQHWINHSFNVSPSKFVADVRKDWRCR